MEKKPIELYLHIPFCIRKCLYCDFLSFPASDEAREAYVRELCREIRSWDRRKEYEITTVFLGGGTPSVLRPDQVEDIFKAIRSSHDLRADCEVTIECNPGTLTEEKLRAYLQCGINRLSLGLQSADDRELERLGRIHTWQQFLENYLLARRLGFDNINVDLMSALPGQTAESWKSTLEKAAALQPEHISAYSLIIEEGTPFYQLYGEENQKRERGEDCTLLPGEEEERAMYEYTGRYLSALGYERYEFSNYAKPGKACRHNIGYWRRREYKGFGLGAASLLCNRRIRNVTEMESYLQGNWTEKKEEPLTRENQMEETMFLGLRMTEGVSKAVFRETFGVPVEQIYGPVLERFASLGLLVNGKEYVALTEKGADVSNYVLAEFLLS